MNDVHVTGRTTTGSRARLVWILCTCAAGIALAAFLWTREHPAGTAAAPRDEKAAAAPGGAGPGGAMRAPPVTVTNVLRGDVPVILEGLGTVTPIASVTVRSQVDGRLESIGFEEGKPVERGQLLAQIDPRPFRIRAQEARAAIARDRAAMQNGELDLKRYEELKQENLIPQQQLDTQRAQVAQMSATLAMDEATLADAELQLQYTRITAPIDGVAGIRKVHPGNLVRSSDVDGLVLLTQIEPISVELTLPQDELPRVARALQRGNPSVQALDRAGENVLGLGRLTVLDNQVNADTASLRLKAEFDNADRALWPSQFVKTRVEIEVRKDVLSVPAEAIVRGPRGDFVYVVDAGNKAEQRPVTVQALESGRALIANGLREDERVIVDGQDQVKPGGSVQPRAAQSLAKTDRAPPADVAAEGQR
jgi:multidrug efflux system membrane fusion protein